MATGTPPPDRAMRLVLPTGIGSTSKPTDITASPPAGEAKRPADWEWIEGQYRAGGLTLREIADAQGITHAAVAKRAKRDGWERDLASKIQRRAEVKLQRAELEHMREAVSKGVTNEKKSLVTKASELAIVESQADLVMRVKMGQRSRFHRMGELATRLFAELETQVTQRSALESILEEAILEGSVGTLAGKALYEMMSFEGNVDSLAKLTSVINTITEMERKAFKLDTYVDPGSKTGRESIPIQFIEPPHRPDGEDD